MQPENNFNRVANHFNTNWERYKRSVASNALFHKEMYAALDEFLNKLTIHKPFVLVDVGCGDSSAIFPILINKPIQPGCQLALA